MKTPGKSEKKTKLKKVNLWITSQQDHFLEELAKETEISKSEHHRRAMDLYRCHLQNQVHKPE